MLQHQSNHKSLLNNLKALDLQDNQSRRMDCPVCGGKNSFSVRSINGTLFYYCFRASCNIKGRGNTEITLESIQKPKPIEVKDIWTLPTHFSNPIQNQNCFSFMKYWRLLDPYKLGDLELYADIKQERLIFPLRNYEKQLKGAVGRTIRNGLPKWFIYNRQDSCPYIRQKKECKDVILVEDAVSAVRCSLISNSMALLGTNLPFIDNLSEYLEPYDRVYIALDDDATRKAPKLHRELNPFKETKIIPLKKDIKYFSDNELLDMKKEYF